VLRHVLDYLTAYALISRAPPTNVPAHYLEYDDLRPQLRTWRNTTIAS